MKIAVLTLGSYAANCYLVWDEASRDCVVIDPGAEGDANLRALAREKLQPQAVLLTHGHFDHVGGVPELRAAGAEVWLCREDLALEGGMTTLDPAARYRFWEDGQQVRFGTLEFQVLRTPGHTPGSCCLAIGDVLFTGDTLFTGSCGRTDFPGGSSADMCASLRRLAALPGDWTVLPGHGSATTLERERRTNPYLSEAAQS